MSQRGILCPQCGLLNHLADIECRRCGASLVSDAVMELPEAHEVEPAVREVDRTRLGIAAAAGTILLVVGAIWAVAYINAHVYIGGEPLYDSKPPRHWVEMLEHDDVYLRRRAALALEALAPKLKSPSLPVVMPALEQAMEDEDEIVRKRAAHALELIAPETRVS
jgi:hypothetical protein